jgi:hypothetical protein
MKKSAFLILISLIGCLLSASGQGLLSIGESGSFDDFDSKLPFTTTVTGDLGFDSNVGNRPDGLEGESGYIRGGVGAAYAGGTRRTHIDLNARLSTLYYFDQPESQADDNFQTGRLGLKLHHRLNSRTTVGNSAYISYEIEPDDAIGASASRRLDQYSYRYNNLWISHSWSRRVSTVARFTVTGIDYENDIESVGEDRLTQTFSKEVRYVLDRLTSLVGEYRRTNTDYDIVNLDYDANYLLAGADHKFNDNVNGTLRLGGENRNYDNNDDDGWNPYAEASLRYELSDRTKLVWFTRYGYEDSEVFYHLANSRSVFRTALNASHAFSDDLRGKAGLSYHSSDYDRGVLSELTEYGLSLNLGLNYRVMSNTDLNLGYTLTTHTSDSAFREYDRHRLWAGISVTF